jgi:beta-galactosidase
MKTFSRRDVLKTSLLAPAVAATAHAIGPIDPAVHAATGEVSGPLSAPATLASPTPGAGRERLLLDFGWSFHFGHADDPAQDFGYGSADAGNFQKTGNFMPAGSTSFSDADWRRIDLPHDWTVELPFKNDPDLQNKGFYPLGRKYPETSVGWYRRIFELSAEDHGKRITIEFDGAYRETTVIFNGFYIGQHSGGYDSFSFDVSDFANPGQPNVLLVRVDATGSDGWFYEGAGIYRHVWLVKTHPVHIKQWGTLVRSEIRSNAARLSILSEVENHGNASSNVRVISTIVDPTGSAVAKDVSTAAAIMARDRHDFTQDIVVSRPALWSLEERNLYKLLTEVQVDGKTVDRYETPFGIRSVQFDQERGFLLNGAPVKLKGTCNHQDHAGIGVALPDAVQYYRVRKLQEMGCNSLRTSHNPPTPELLDACDRLGMLVMDETRMMSSNPEGLCQFADLVRRDRNHPSVFVWSLGNEEPTATNAKGANIVTAMKEVATRHDGSRPTTIDGMINGEVSGSGTGGLAVCDVIGYHYADPQAEAFHKAHPEKLVLGTETVSAVCTRGIYITDKSKGFVSSYDPYTTSGRASAEGWWSFCNARPWLGGGYVWTGFDYRGEPSPNGWPNISSQYGIIDMCGFPKDSFFYYQSWWTDKPVLHLFPHWNWPGYEGKKIAVWVYSNLDKVELFLNGQSLGAKDVKKDAHVAWNVEYAPGSIEARGWKDGKQVMTARRETTGAAAKLVLRPDRDSLFADGEDVAMFAVEVQDANGRTMPITDNLVTFKIAGPARLIGVGNGDPTDLSPDKGTSRKAFSGYCMALVQTEKTPGAITVKVTSPGLTAASANVRSKPIELRTQVSIWNRPIPKGTGVTGLWVAVSDPGTGLAASALGSPRIFTLTQQGGKLTGTVEGPGGWFGGDDAPAPIRDGVVEGDHISFKSSINVFNGKIKGAELELQRTVNIPFSFPTPPKQDPNGPVIGPAPDGSDPSSDFADFSGPGNMSVVLRRSER